MALDLIPSSHPDQDYQQDDAFNGDWYEDGSDASELNREQKAREDEFHMMGYRDGFIAGKEASAQEGFNIGYKQSAPVGYNWGIVRGVTSVLTTLPDHLKEKLAATPESIGKLGKLHECVQFSTDDAFKIFRDDMISSGLEQPCHQSEGFDQLGNHYRELKSLICEFPDIKLHQQEKKMPCTKIFI